MIVNFVQFPGISSARGRPGVFIGVKARGQGPTPHILITEHPGETKRECEFYNLSVII